MLAIRFNRIGRRNRTYYRIVVQEHSVAPGGRHVAVVGSHDPHAKKTILKEDEIKHWLSVGAQPSDTVYNLLVKHGIIIGKKRPKGKVVKEEVTKESEESVDKDTDTAEDDAKKEEKESGADGDSAQETKEKEEQVTDQAEGSEK
jgi:small subunit ribosomal protein S16